jgi:hypothetical protein
MILEDITPNYTRLSKNEIIAIEKNNIELIKLKIVHI